jgi:hypothetical protein
MAAAGRDRVLRLLSPFQLDHKVPPYFQSFHYRNIDYR